MVDTDDTNAWQLLGANDIMYTTVACMQLGGCFLQIAELFA